MRVVGAYEPRVARAAALAAVVLVLACGGGSSGPAPVGGGGGPAPSGPDGSPPAGDGGSGGAPSTGSGAGAPAAGDGSGVGSSGGGGSGAPSAGGDGGGSSGPGTGAPAAGAGGGGGGGASACADLVPAFGAAVEQQFDTGTHRDCSVATTSASGQVALGIGGSWGGFAGTMFDLYSADGSETGWVDGIVFAFIADQGQDVDPMFHQTSGGYGGIVHPGNANPLPFRTWDANGRLVAEIERFAVSTAPDRNGGSLLLAQAYDPASVTSPPGATRLQWIDAAGELARAVTLDRDARLVISNWGTGHVVVVVPASPGSARWFDESGSPLTPWFDIGDVSSAPSLHLLLDGTVAIRAGGRWTVALTDGATSAGAVPAWLASRPSTRLATIRQGRAYAVLPMGGTPGDATSFEIVAASGQSCGSFSIPPAAEPPGVVKKPRRLDVGQDGTLLQQSAVLLTPNPFGIHCAFRWWPKLLQ